MDPFNKQTSLIHVPLAEFGVRDDEQYQAHDLLTDERYLPTTSRRTVSNSVFSGNYGDTGGGIVGQHLDWFVGLRASYAALDAALALDQVTVHDGGARCP